MTLYTEKEDMFGHAKTMLGKGWPKKTNSEQSLTQPGAWYLHKLCSSPHN